MLRSVLPIAALACLLPVPAAAQIARFAPPGTTSSPLLQAVCIPAGAELFYVSGQIAAPIDPARPLSPSLDTAAMGDTRRQTISALGKAKAILEAHGYALGDVVKATVFLVGDPAKGGAMDFAGMNEGFNTFFGTAANPVGVTRSTVQVSAVAYPSFLIEIELIAAKAPAGAKCGRR